MNPSRFDSISKLLTSRKLTRRQAVARTGTGIAGGAMAVAMGSHAALAAQDATPVTPATPTTGADGNDPSMLFVQSFQSGSIAPKEGADGRFTVTLEDGLGQTIYFSDRPDRIAGAMPTNRFLNWLGFSEENPPNAAILTDDGDGETTLAVVELFDPVYDADSSTATYDLAMLEHWEDGSTIGFTETPVELGAMGASFGTAHLFIDGLWDCPDATMSCYRNGEVIGTIANADHDGYCAQGNGACFPCEYGTDPGYWTDQCNQRFSACQGECTLWNFCSRDAPFADTYCINSDSHMGAWD